MKTRWIYQNTLGQRILGGALGMGLLLAASGCAAHRPCPIIPAQLELAEEQTELAQGEYDQASEEFDRIQANVVRIEQNIARLEAEKEILLELVGDGGEDE